MDMAWPSYTKSRAYVVVPYWLLYLNFKLISGAFPILRHKTGLYWKIVFLGAEGRRGWRERGPLLLFNPPRH
jgi:hypothetical protein